MESDLLPIDEYHHQRRPPPTEIGQNERARARIFYLLLHTTYYQATDAMESGYGTRIRELARIVYSSRKVLL